MSDRDAEDRLYGVCRETVLPGRQVSGNKTRQHTDTFITFDQRRQESVTSVTFTCISDTSAALSSLTGQLFAGV